MSIGSNIKHFRKLNGWNQKELGEKIGVSNKTISSWEIDRTEPNMEYFDKLCVIFSCSRNQLVNGFEFEYDYAVEIADGAVEIVDLYSRATPPQRKAVIALLRSFFPE